MALTKIQTTDLSSNLATTIAQGGGIPKITSIDYPGDDTAADPAGGQTIVINGSNFTAQSVVYLAGNPVSPLAFVNSTALSFTAPAAATGVYSLYVVNSDGATAIGVPGLLYSGLPTWSTASGSVGSVYETGSVSVSLEATGDGTVTYSVSNGNTIPTGLTLNSNGLLTGTVPATDPTTTYTFSVDAIDEQNQETARSFSITFLKDEVTWSSPAEGTVYEWNVGEANTITLVANSAAGQNVTYSVTSGSLPANVSISGDTIAGTPNTAQVNTSVTVTATADNTERIAERIFYFVINELPSTTYASFNVSGQTSYSMTNIVHKVESGKNYIYGVLRFTSAAYGVVFKYNITDDAVVWAKDITLTGLLNYYTKIFVDDNLNVFIATVSNSPEYNVFVAALQSTTGTLLWKQKYDSQDYSVSGSTDAVLNLFAFNDRVYNSFTSIGQPAYRYSTLLVTVMGGDDYGFLVIEGSSGQIIDYLFYPALSGGTDGNVAKAIIVGPADNNYQSASIYAYHNPNAGRYCITKVYPFMLLSEDVNYKTSGMEQNKSFKYGANTLYSLNIFTGYENQLIMTATVNPGPLFANSSIKEFCYFTEDLNARWVGSSEFTSSADPRLHSFYYGEGQAYAIFAGTLDQNPGTGQWVPFLIKLVPGTPNTIEWAVKFTTNSTDTYRAMPDQMFVINNSLYFSYRNNLFSFPLNGNKTGTFTVGGVEYTISNLSAQTTTYSLTANNEATVSMYSDSGGKTWSTATMSFNTVTLDKTSNTY